MIADSIIENVLKALHDEGNPFFDLQEDDLLADSELELGPVSRIGTQPKEPRIELESFDIESKQRTPAFIDAMTSTRKERRIAEETAAGATPGSPAHFQATQAATLPSEKRWFRQENGKIDVARMTPIEKGAHYMKPSAAIAYKAMQRAMKRDLGHGFDITDSYRTYDQQKALKKVKPTLAATPGKSNHGWGIALDINVNDSKVYNWLVKNGKKYGFTQPMDYEPWHWEYEGGYKGSSSKKKKPAKRVRVEDTKPGQTDVATLMKATSSAVLAPMSFASVLGELQEPKPTTRRQYESHKKAAGIAFVPKKYRDWVREAAEKSGLSARLIGSVMQVESGFAEDVINFQRASSAGAKGPMQLMPFWADTYGKKVFKNPRANLVAGAQILANYIEQAGSIRGGLAFYNGGPGNPQFDYADTVLNILRGGK